MYDLFSEFTALVMIGRTTKIEKQASCEQQKFKRSPGSKDYLSELMPISGKLTKYKAQK